MNKRSLDTYDAASGIDRALGAAQRLADTLAKRGAKPEEIAAELKRSLDAHRRWSEDASKYHQLVNWWERDLSDAEKASRAGKLAGSAIDQLGEVLERNRIIGY